ncbi:hypothetical protein R1flu_015789 [Riccia fluitans]|uniref:Photosynthesis system II assembly factor Ycf48/Hcf136-like domain-containing protein n=1 Tax=Riccia fluitans TaxID=41844 RepID=A0ABD1YKG0_9MARC
MASAGLRLLPSGTIVANSAPTSAILVQKTSSSSRQLTQFNGFKGTSDFCAACALPKSSSAVAVPNGFQGVRASAEDKACIGRRELLSAATGLSLGGIVGGALITGEAKAEAELADWERIPLPVEKGVVLLDLAFVPDEPDHGFLLGTRQTLLETKDGGKTWIPRSIPTGPDEEFNYRLNSVSFLGKEGWISGKPAILLHTTNGGESWERVPLSPRLPGNPVIVKATGENSAEMVTDEGAIYVTSNSGRNWRAAVEETLSATLNRGSSSQISGASYYTGTLGSINRSSDGTYVGVSSRGNFYVTWEPGQRNWQPHNRTSARRIQNMGFRADGGLWLVVRGGGLFFSKGTGIGEDEGEDPDFEEAKITSRGFGILDVGYRTKDEAWATGGSGTLLRSLDGGKSWVRDKAADNIGANLYSVKFIDEKKGFVIGNDGVLLRYLG